MPILNIQLQTNRKIVSFENLRNFAGPLIICDEKFGEKLTSWREKVKKILLAHFMEAAILN